MNRPIFEYHMERLYNCFGKQHNKKQIDDWYDAYQQINENTFECAINGIKRTHKTFPSQAEVWKAIGDIKESEWNREKVSEYAAAKKVFEKQRYSGVGYSAIILIRAALGIDERKLSVIELIKQMDLCEATYPGIGWSEEAGFLRAEHEKHKNVVVPDWCMPLKTNKKGAAVNNNHATPTIMATELF